MASYVEPAVIQQVVEPGDTYVQVFNLRQPPDDTITATIVGDRGHVRLLDMWASVKKEITGDPIWPDEAAPHRDPDTAPHEVDRKVVAQMHGEGSMAVKFDQFVEGQIEFSAAVDAASGVTHSVLQLRGQQWEGLDIPIKLITGSLLVDFGPGRVLTYQGQTIDVPFHVSLPPGHAAAQLQLQGFGTAPNWDLRGSVAVSSGESVPASLTVWTSPAAPLGDSDVLIGVSGFDQGRAVPLKITTMPFSRIVQADDAIKAKAEAASLIQPLKMLPTAVSFAPTRPATSTITSPRVRTGYTAAFSNGTSSAVGRPCSAIRSTTKVAPRAAAGVSTISRMARSIGHRRRGPNRFFRNSTVARLSPSPTYPVVTTSSALNQR